MNATQLLKLLTEGKTEQAILLLKQDIAKNETDNKDLYKARVKLATAAHNDMKKSRPSLAGAFESNGCQVICNGYWGVKYKDIADGLLQADKTTGSQFNIDKVLPTSLSGYDEINVDLKKISSELKISKAEKIELLIKCGSQYLNPKYLLMVLSSLENPEIYVAYGYKSMYIKAENGEAVIIPIKCNDEKMITMRVINA